MENETGVRPVTDLDAEELNSLAAEAWKAAAREALAKGLAVTGSRDGRRFRYHPDGRVEDLGPVSASGVAVDAGGFVVAALDHKIASETAEPIESGAPKKVQSSA